MSLLSRYICRTFKRGDDKRDAGLTTPDYVILRIKDDCVPFDPHDRQAMAESGDPVKNIGIRMVFRIAKDVQYQNILGLNVLTVRIAE